MKKSIKKYLNYSEWSKRTKIIIAAITATVLVIAAVAIKIADDNKINNICEEIATNTQQLNSNTMSLKQRADDLINEVKNTETNQGYLETGADNELTSKLISLAQSNDPIDTTKCSNRKGIEKNRQNYVEQNKATAELREALHELDQDFYIYISQVMLEQANSKLSEAQAAEKTARDDAQTAITEAIDGDYTNGFADSEDGAKHISDLKEVMLKTKNKLVINTQLNTREQAEITLVKATQIQKVTNAIKDSTSKLSKATSDWQETKRAEEAAAIAAQQAATQAQAQQQRWGNGYNRGGNSYNRNYNAPRRSYSGGGSSSNNYSRGGLQDSGYPVVPPHDPESLKQNGDGWNCSCIGDVCIGKACG